MSYAKAPVSKDHSLYKGMAALSWAGHRILREFATRKSIPVAECWELDQRYFAVMARRQWIQLNGTKFSITAEGKKAFEAYDTGEGERRQIQSLHMKFAKYFDPLHLGVPDKPPTQPFIIHRKGAA